MDALTVGFVVFAVVVTAVGIVQLFVRDRSGALDDDKAGMEPAPEQAVRAFRRPAPRPRLNRRQISSRNRS